MASFNNEPEPIVNLQYMLEHPININKPRKLSRQIVDVIEYNGNFYGLKSDDYQNKIPLLTSNDLSSIEPGIYCWIIGQDKNSNYQLFFKPVFSYHEMGTKHNVLVTQAKSYTPTNSSSQVKPIVNLLFAGEFRFDGTNILFNLLSGTYMYGLINPIHVPEDIKTNIINYFKRILGSSQINVQMDIVKTRTNENGEIEYISLFDKDSDIFKNKEKILLHLLWLGVGLFKFRTKENYNTYIKQLRRNNANTIRSLNNAYTKINSKNRFGFSRRQHLFNNSNQENQGESASPQFKKSRSNNGRNGRMLNFESPGRGKSNTPTGKLNFGSNSNNNIPTTPTGKLNFGSNSNNNMPTTPIKRV